MGSLDSAAPLWLEVLTFLLLGELEEQPIVSASECKLRHYWLRERSQQTFTSIGEDALGWTCGECHAMLTHLALFSNSRLCQKKPMEGRHAITRTLARCILAAFDEILNRK